MRCTQELWLWPLSPGWGLQAARGWLSQAPFGTLVPFSLVAKARAGRVSVQGPRSTWPLIPQASVHTGFAGPGPPRRLGLGRLGSSLKTLSHLFSKAALVSKDRQHTYFRRLAQTAVWGSHGLAFLSIHNRVVLYGNQILSASVSSYLRFL